MNRKRVGMSILSLAAPGIEAITDPDHAFDTARRGNDFAAENLVARHPDRLRAFACVPLQRPERGADEIVGSYASLVSS
jgi:predicted TIM-barrel fold metal-dependent hydrolase